MPKAAIDEDSDLAAGPCEIRFAWNLPMFAITAQSLGPQEFPERQLCSSVASRAHRRHDFGTPFFGNMIHIGRWSTILSICVGLEVVVADRFRRHKAVVALIHDFYLIVLQCQFKQRDDIVRHELRGDGSRSEGRKLFSTIS